MALAIEPGNITYEHIKTYLAFLVFLYVVSSSSIDFCQN